MTLIHFCLQEPNDKYAMLMDDLRSDRRGRPTDRTKTPEEIAQEEREKLEELEVFL